MTTVTLDTTHGDIVIELYDDKAPETVKNFLNYVNDGFFDGTIFHRVIPNFMIQGGGFMPGMVQKKCEDPIKNEADNGLSNDRGTLAMARTNDPHSATAQFFINHNDNTFLNHSAPTGTGWGDIVYLVKSQMVWTLLMRLQQSALEVILAMQMYLSRPLLSTKLLSPIHKSAPA